MSRDANKRALSAWVKWATIIGCPTNAETLYKFAAFIGDPFPSKSDRKGIINIENPEVMKRIDMIHGPNGHIIVKAFIARSS